MSKFSWKRVGNFVNTYCESLFFTTILGLLVVIFVFGATLKKNRLHENNQPIIYTVDNQDSYVIGTVESKYRFDEDNYIMVLDGGRMYKITFQQYEQIETGDKVFSYIKETSEE